MYRHIRSFAAWLTIRRLLLLAATPALLVVSAIVFGFDPVSYSITIIFAVAGFLHGAGLLPKRWFE